MQIKKITITERQEMDGGGIKRGSDTNQEATAESWAKG